MRQGGAVVALPLHLHALVIRNIGNSKGILLPEPLLAQVGLDDSTVAEATIEHGAILLRKLAQPAGAGWVQAGNLAASVGRHRQL